MESQDGVLLDNGNSFTEKAAVEEYAPDSKHGETKNSNVDEVLTQNGIPEKEVPELSCPAGKVSKHVSMGSILTLLLSSNGE